MTVIDAELLGRLPLAEIVRVTFFKRDKLTADLFCCEVAIGAQCRTFHEELADWPLLLSHLQQLPNFRSDRFSEMAQPSFDACESEAIVRQPTSSQPPRHGEWCRSGPDNVADINDPCKLEAWLVSRARFAGSTM